MWNPLLLELIATERQCELLALPNRQPTVLAKMAETLDRLSAGRLILALGSGAAINEPAYRAFGLAQRSAREKVAALEEAIDVLRGLWSSSSFSYAGQHFQTDGAVIEPKPSQPIPIWLGVFGDSDGRAGRAQSRRLDPNLPISRARAGL